MYCPDCGNKLKEESKFCGNCGAKFNDIKSNAGKEIIKNYSPIFWKYFWFGFLINILSRSLEYSDSTTLLILFILVICFYIYGFSRVINEAMLSIGKKNWWPLGLLSLIPFGFWVVFLIIRAKLKPHGKWISRKDFKYYKE